MAMAAPELSDAVATALGASLAAAAPTAAHDSKISYDRFFSAGDWTIMANVGAAGIGSTITATVALKVNTQLVVASVATTPNGLVMPVPKDVVVMLKLPPVPAICALTLAPAPLLSNISYSTPAWLPVISRVTVSPSQIVVELVAATAWSVGNGLIVTVVAALCALVQVAPRPSVTATVQSPLSPTDDKTTALVVCIATPSWYHW